MLNHSRASQYCSIDEMIVENFFSRDFSKASNVPTTGNAEQSQVKKCAVEGWRKIFCKHNTTIAVVRKERVAAHAKRRIKGIVSLVTILVAVMFSQRHLPEGTILFTPFGCSCHEKPKIPV